MKASAKHLFIVNDFPPIIGGQSAYLHHVCRSFAKDVVVLAPACGDTAAFDAAQPFATIRKAYLSNIPVLEKFLKIVVPLIEGFRLVRRGPIKMVHCGHVLSTGFVGLILKKLTGVEYVVYTYCADVLEYEHKPLWGYCLRGILKEARYVVTISRFMQKELEKLGVPKERIIVSCPKVDPDVFVRNAAWTDILAPYQIVGKRIILGINRLVERKGNDMVIRALPGLLQKFPDLVYVVFGRGPHADTLKALAWAEGVEKSVVFIEGSDEERLALLAACEIFIMVSREGGKKGDLEGFGIVYLEAGVCGKPVVAGNIGGVLDAVVPDKTGLCVDPTSPEALGRAVATLLSDRDLERALGSAGQMRVFAQFDARRGAPELDIIFREAARA